ncbi:ribosomal protection-like ABC-F family protein [Streptomyces silaceus]|uniref:ribosomal protection-like ABC-F family protein n=1 Tax=Streptomyces silaceus TaxID=545123 RepID=UPI0006EB9158|nr:ABC-F family ATP-binding cassette domain-containing protein [Streptomyces silaceus]
MTATLVAKNLAAGHGDRTLFTGLDLAVTPGEVTGLVGANGAGKSTLLRILAGLDTPEQGQVRAAPATATIGYLPQEPDRRPGETVYAFLARRTGVTAAQHALDTATRALADGTAGADEEYAAGLERWLSLGGADLEERAEHVAATLGLGIHLEQAMTSLSGGQAARAQLASLLLSRHDVLLLDEPTNDLDLAGLEQLEQFVRGLRAGAVVVSHDREFLARTVTQVLELDRAQQQVRLFGGGYAAYLQERERARRHARDQYEQYAERKAALQERASMHRSWADKGVRTAQRRGRDNDKFARRGRMENSENLAGKAKQAERLIERLEEVEEPRKEWQLRLQIATAPRSGTVVSTLRQARVHRGDFTLGPVSLEIGRTDRVAITGANGSGKSTLLGALLGRIPLDAGHQTLGSGVVIGEIDQARALFRGRQRLLDAFRSAIPSMEPAEVRTLLAKFGLGAEHVLRETTTLSPGERTRAALALLQGRGVNLLVLDEPTNHLDLPAIEQLESALDTYDGTLLLVSHDRRLLDAVRLTRRLALDDGTVTDTPV